MSNYKSHRHTADEEGSRRKEEGQSRGFCDKLQASQMCNMTNWMSNCRTHGYTTDGESTVWTSMRKPFVIDGIVFVIDV